jgi:CDGSH-type Zn-finger protein
MSNHSVTIKSAENGPYLVRHLEHFSNRKGAIECKESMALCRCGLSAKKTFCDGSHSKAGFDSANQLDPARDQLASYQSKKITVHDNRSICAHAGYCTEGLPSVFRQHEEPFVDPDGASVEAIIDVIKKCPSGALSYTIEDSDETIGLDAASVFIAPNGPYVIKGQTVLSEVKRGKGASPNSMTLCRCGASKNKPFCDGSHWVIGFSDDEN